MTRRFGEHRCELECEKVEIVDTETGEHVDLVLCDDDEPAEVVGDAQAEVTESPGRSPG